MVATIIGTAELRGRQQSVRLYAISLQQKTASLPGMDSVPGVVRKGDAN
jgi:hypothetical protein